jgi:hypothetical protein
MEIDINEYLSEEDKKEIAIDVFRQQVKNQLFKKTDGTVQSDSEIQRVIGNITHEIVFQEVQKYIPDAEELVKKNVMKAIKKDMTYQVFKKKDAWDREESLATKYMREEMIANEESFKERIREAMASYDLDPSINEELSNKFDELGGSMYALSELFLNKKEG